MTADDINQEELMKMTEEYEEWRLNWLTASVCDYL